MKQPIIEEITWAGLGYVWCSYSLQLSSAFHLVYSITHHLAKLKHITFLIHINMFHLTWNDSSVYFVIFRVLWLHFEGGLMKYFGKGTRSRHIENVEETKNRLITYFKKRVSNKYAVYLGGFIFCEILNLAVVISHFYITDRFLNYRLFRSK